MGGMFAFASITILGEEAEYDCKQGICAAYEPVFRAAFSGMPAKGNATHAPCLVKDVH